MQVHWGSRDLDGEAGVDLNLFVQQFKAKVKVHTFAKFDELQLLTLSSGWIFIEYKVQYFWSQKRESSGEKEKPKF